MSTKEILDIFIPLLQAVDKDLHQTLASLKELELDPNEQIAYLRGKVIHWLIMECAEVFWKHQDLILSGQFNAPLIDRIENPKVQEVLEVATKISVQKIYNFKTVVQIELAGYKVMSGLLEEFLPAMLSVNETTLSVPAKHNFKKRMELLPIQYQGYAEDNFSRIQSVVDFVSGMTDIYAVDFISKIKRN